VLSLLCGAAAASLLITARRRGNADRAGREG
jgi:hypothetical protein